MKLALQAEIGLHGIEPPQHVAAKIALPVVLRGLKTESGLIENLAAGILRAIKNERHSGVDVGARIKLSASGKVSSANKINGRGRAGQDKTVEGPATKGRMKKFLRARSWDVVSYTGGESMANVEIGIAAVHGLIGAAAGSVDVVGEGVGGGIVNRVGESIGRQCLQPLGQPALEFELCSMVIRPRRVIG